MKNQTHQQPMTMGLRFPNNVARASGPCKQAGCLFSFAPSRLRERIIPVFAALAAFAALTAAEAAGPGKHLFIMSGQSNMQRLEPAISFTPAIEAALGRENVMVVKHALGGQPIRRWYKQWTPLGGTVPQNTGDLYDRLMEKVSAASAKQSFATVTFVWMQGEKDAKESHGEVYAASLKGLIAQLRGDLGRQDVNVVIGRLSDYDLNNRISPHWTMVRQAQMEVAEADPRAVWVDTDDLNDGTNEKGKPIQNDLHYSVEGYRTFGKRLAEAAIQLIQQVNLSSGDLR